MDVQSHLSEEKLSDPGSRGPGGGSLRPRRRAVGSRAWIGQALGEWQLVELRIARGFPECRRLSAEQLEDIYQETALALLSRPYQSEEHLRNALRTGIKHRALNLHRDERRRGEILAQNAPGMHDRAEARAGQDAPDFAALLHEDRLIAAEFLTELTEAEQRVFALLVEGMQYRAIAPVLGIEVNVARNAVRACDRKRERFQLLYDTGRLCGFRSATILALQSGEATSEQLAERAFAHLEGCAHCRAEHKTNARRLRRSFQGQAAALLPLPALLARLGWLTRLDVRLRALLHRFMPDGIPLGSGGVRERAVALLAGGGAATKLAAGVATVAVIASGTFGATRVLDHGSGAAHRHRASRSGAPGPSVNVSQSAMSRPPLVPQAAVLPHATSPARRRKPSSTPGGVRSAPRASSGQREPGGFAYLGVPTEAPATATPAPARAASTGGGGQFSP
jgi:RNA polymerase sigma factor (sigma-70 family)